MNTMKKYVIIWMGCLAIIGFSSCASTKKHQEGSTKEARKKEKKEAQLAKEKENNKALWIMMKL